MNASRAWSSCASAWAAVTIVRNRDLSIATVGNTTGWAKTPSSISRAREASGGVGVAHHHRRDRRLGAARVEAQTRQLGLEPAGVGPQPLLQLGLLLHDPDGLATGRHDRRRMRGGEEERAGPLGEDLAQGRRAGDVAAERADRLRQRADLDRDAAVQPEVVDRPAAVRPSTPDAWASSTMTAAPNASAASTIPGSGAMSPSIEKTPSVTTRIRRYGSPVPSRPRSTRLARGSSRSASTSACG